MVSPTNNFALCRVGCDIVVFLVFNEFKTCAGGGSDGHQFSGIAEGGACEGTYGSGYVIAVDQGKLHTSTKCVYICNQTHARVLFFYTVLRLMKPTTCSNPALP